MAAPSGVHGGMHGGSAGRVMQVRPSATCEATLLGASHRLKDMRLM